MKVATMSTTSAILRAAYQPDITFAMIKSDAFDNGVASAVLRAIRCGGFAVIEGINTFKLSLAQIHALYADHVLMPYFPSILQSVNRTVMPLILERRTLVYDGSSAVSDFRALIGATDARKAKPSSVRARYGGHNFDCDAPLAANAVHGSDSLASAVQEIGIIFDDHDFYLRSIHHGIFPLSDFLVDAHTNTTW